ncbi:ABC transporter permease [Gorillibacterium massiliense]|uniref:ABC transporter permease n=1 Tax=Gorillibacterium massiliense TaxID=1280390 RepID=UPI0004AD91E1|nr:ABC transporter permease [Gorillibacterium massiliense]
MSTPASAEKAVRESLTDWKLLYRRYGIVLIFIAIFIISAMLNSNFLEPQNLLNIVRQNSVIAILACAQTILIVSGMIDLSAGFVLALSGCVACGVMVSTGSVSAALLTGIAIGGLCGWLNGFLITRFSLQPFIATLAMANVANGITQVYTGGSAISGIKDLKYVGQGKVGTIPLPIIIMVVIVLLIWFIMKHTKFGLYIYAIGGNEKATIASGVQVNRMKRLIFLLSGLLVGLAGVVLMARLNSGQPSVGTGKEFDAITAAVVGGTSFNGGIGNVFGTLVGALIVGMINNILNLMNVSTQYQLIIKGLLIAGAVIIDIRTKTAKS